MAAADYYIVIQQLYIAYFGRAADPEGLVNYADNLARLRAPANIVDLSVAYNANSDIRDLIDSFGVSVESKKLYPTGNNGDFVDAIYQYLLNRAPDTAGRDYWKGEIDSGRLSKGNAALAIAAGAMTNGSLDGTLITQKTNVAIEFTGSLDTDAEKAAYAGAEAAEVARDMLAQVGSDTTLAELGSLVESAVETLVENAEEEEEEEEEGGADVLTSGKDTLTGTADDDTFTGVIAGNLATGTTFNAFDTLKGGDGDDTLQIDISGGTSTVAVTVSSTTLESIESVLIANSGENAKGYVLNATNWKGVTTLGLSSSSATGDTKFTNVGTLVEAHMKNGEGDLEIRYQATVVSGTANHNQKLILDDVMAGTFTADSGIETVTIVSTSGNASTLTGLTASGASTLVIQTDSELTIQNPLGTTIKTVDASLSTGAVSLNFSKTTNSLTISVGSGNDSIIAGAGNDTFKLDGKLTKSATIDGGNGTDTISINSADIAAMSNMTDVEEISALKSRITSIEKVVVNTAFGSHDIASNVFYLSNLGGNVTYLVLNEESSANYSTTVGIADSSTVELIATADGDSSGDSTLQSFYINDASASNNTLTFKLTNGSVSEDWGSIDAVGVENIIVDSNATAVSSKNTLALNASSATQTKLTITGNAYLDLRGLNSSTLLNFATINASANTGGVSIKGGASNQVITGSKLADSINGFGGADTIKAGEGNDTIVFDGKLNKSVNIDGGNGTDTISINAADIVALNGLTTTESSTLKSKLVSIEKVIVSSVWGDDSLSSNDLVVSRLGSSIKHIVLSHENNNDIGSVIKNMADSSTVELLATSDQDASADSSTAYLSLTDSSASNNTLTLKLTGGSVSEDWGNIETSGVENIIIDSNSTVASSKNTLVLNAISATQKKLTVTGNAYLDLRAYNESVTPLNFATIDALANTGGIKISGGSSNQTFIGSAGADSINGGGGNDTITGGTGNDTLTGGEGLDVLTGGTGADSFSFTDVEGSDNIFDRIDDFDKSADTLEFLNPGTNDNFRKNIVDTWADLGALQDAARLVLADNGNGNIIKYFFGLAVNDDETSGYLVYDIDGDDIVNVIELVGVTDLDISNIV